MFETLGQFCIALKLGEQSLLIGVPAGELESFCNNIEYGTLSERIARNELIQFLVC